MEADVCVWHYTLLVVHARTEEESPSYPMLKARANHVARQSLFIKTSILVFTVREVFYLFLSSLSVIFIRFCSAISHQLAL